MAKLSVHNKLVRHAKRRILKYAEGFPEIEVLPSVIAVTGESDYCGMMVSYGESGVVERSVMVLCYDEIVNAADHDEIPLKQAIEETIYHEWIHFVHAQCFPDDYDLLMTHEGELWDNLITIGLCENWITREKI